MWEERVERRIATIAARQYGVVTADQLTASGISTSTISRWTAAGRLHRVHRAVYAVGHAGLSLEGQWKAAALTCGEGSVLSHRSAAELWQMLEPADGPIHITVVTPGGRVRRSGLQIHRSPSLQSADITIHHGIPVTRPQQTLLDLRRSIEPGELRRAVRQAELRRLPIDASAVIPDRTTSELELRFLRLCQRHRLPLPEVNVLVAGFRVDFLWRRERLIVETDGRAFHRGVVASGDDQERDLRLGAFGYEVLRLTWWDVVDDRAATAARVRARLRARSTQSSR